MLTRTPKCQDSAHQDVCQPHNVLIFGETGVGKSSIINMLDPSGCLVAPASNNAWGCTQDNTSYDVKLGGIDFRFWDTAGTNEPQGGKVDAEEAELKLIDLVGRRLSGAVTLLVYCIRIGRFRTIVKVNYDLIFKTVCRENVPIVLIVTGMENEDPMESWWTANEGEFERRGLNFDGHACITTTKGRVLPGGSHACDKEFAESQQLVTQLVLKKNKPGNRVFEDVREWRESIRWGVREHNQNLGRNRGWHRYLPVVSQANLKQLAVSLIHEIPMMH